VAVTCQNLVDAASDLSDQVLDPHVANATWLRWANRGQEKLWRRLQPILKDFYHSTTDFTLAGGLGGGCTLAYPATARVIRGVTKDPDNPALRTTIRLRNFEERDEQYLRTYDVLGTNVVIQPFEYAAGTYRLYWVGGPTPFAALTDVLDPQLEPYAEFIETYMAIKGHAKEESDNTDLIQELKDIWTEIESVALAREADVGETIVDVQRTGGGWNYLVRP
jgi:hypothetical protein